jgi:ZIP family zinc transporter/zinc and cadmium transporter
MDERWFSVIFFGSFAGAATFLGMYLILARADWSRRNSASLVSYSAGVLLGVGILHVLPEAQELSAQTPIFFLLSFVLFYFLEHHLFFHAGHEELHHASLEIAASHDACCANPHPLGVIAFAGMTLHSLIDGMVIGAGFEAGSETGLLSALAVIAHEVPEGIAMLAILLHYGYARRTAIIFTSTVAMATPVGAVVTYSLVHHLAPGILGALMAFAAGSFVYIAASDLIPESHRARGLKGSLALCGGILTAAIAGWVAHFGHA